jgi:hypothetical protein
MRCKKPPVKNWLKSRYLLPDNGVPNRLKMLMYTSLQRSVGVMEQMRLRIADFGLRISDSECGRYLTIKSAIFTLWNSAFGGAASGGIPQGRSEIRN